MLYLGCTAIVAHVCVTQLLKLLLLFLWLPLLQLLPVLLLVICWYWHWFPQELVPLSYYSPLVHSSIRQSLVPALAFLDGTAVTAADAISTAAADADAVGIPVLR